VTTERALAAAQDAAQEIARGRYRGPLHGMPIAVKDLCFTRGIRTMAGRVSCETSCRRRMGPSWRDWSGRAPSCSAS